MDDKDENDERLKAFNEWIPEEKLYSKDIYIHKNNLFYGLNMDYGLTVTSKTLEQAREDLRKLVVEYILAFFNSNQPYEKCLRRQPLSIRIRAKMVFWQQKHGYVPTFLRNDH